MDNAENSSGSAAGNEGDKLSSLTYKQLQGVAKDMNLPGNLKWSHLLTLVMARRRGDERTVTALISEISERREKKRSAIAARYKDDEEEYTPPSYQRRTSNKGKGMVKRARASATVTSATVGVCANTNGAGYSDQIHSENSSSLSSERQLDRTTMQPAASMAQPAAGPFVTPSAQPPTHPLPSDPGASTLRPRHYRYKQQQILRHQQQERELQKKQRQHEDQQHIQQQQSGEEKQTPRVQEHQRRQIHDHPQQQQNQKLLQHNEIQDPHPPDQLSSETVQPLALTSKGQPRGRENPKPQRKHQPQARQTSDRDLRFEQQLAEMQQHISRQRQILPHSDVSCEQHIGEHRQTLQKTGMLQERIMQEEQHILPQQYLQQRMHLPEQEPPPAQQEQQQKQQEQQLTEQKQQRPKYSRRKETTPVAQGRGRRGKLRSILLGQTAVAGGGDLPFAAPGASAAGHLWVPPVDLTPPCLPRNGAAADPRRWALYGHGASLPCPRRALPTVLDQHNAGAPGGQEVDQPAQQQSKQRQKKRQPPLPPVSQPPRPLPPQGEQQEPPEDTPPKKRRRAGRRADAAAAPSREPPPSLVPPRHETALLQYPRMLMQQHLQLQQQHQQLQQPLLPQPVQPVQQVLHRHQQQQMPLPAFVEQRYAPQSNGQPESSVNGGSAMQVDTPLGSYPVPSQPAFPGHYFPPPMPAHRPNVAQPLQIAARTEAVGCAYPEAQGYASHYTQQQPQTEHLSGTYLPYPPPTTTDYRAKIRERSYSLGSAPVHPDPYPDPYGQPWAVPELGYPTLQERQYAAAAAARAAAAVAMGTPDVQALEPTCMSTVTCYQRPICTPVTYTSPSAAALEKPTYHQFQQYSQHQAYLPYHNYQLMQGYYAANGQPAAEEHDLHREANSAVHDLSVQQRRYTYPTTFLKQIQQQQLQEPLEESTGLSPQTNGLTHGSSGHSPPQVPGSWQRPSVGHRLNTSYQKIFHFIAGDEQQQDEQEGSDGIVSVGSSPLKAGHTMEHTMAPSSEPPLATSSPVGAGGEDDDEISDPFARLAVEVAERMLTLGGAGAGAEDAALVSSLLAKEEGGRGERGGGEALGLPAAAPLAMAEPSNSNATPCVYAADGCREAPTAAAALRHQSECAYQDSACPLPTCAWTGKLREVAAHCREEHADETLCGFDVAREVSVRSLRAMPGCAFLQEAGGRLYVATARCHGRTLFATLQSVPERGESAHAAPITGWLELSPGGEAAGGAGSLGETSPTAGSAGSAGGAPLAAWRGQVLPVTHATAALWGLRQCLVADASAEGMLMSSSMLTLRSVLACSATPNSTSMDDDASPQGTTARWGSRL